MSRVVSMFFILSMATMSLTRKLSKCELVYELRRHNFPEYLMRDVVCLVRAESSFRTETIEGPNNDGSRNWGIFRISDRYWCNTVGVLDKGCNVYCNDLVSDNITASANCARIILNRQGLVASPGWVSRCKDRWQPDLNCDCGNNDDNE